MDTAKIRRCFASETSAPARGLLLAELGANVTDARPGDPVCGVLRDPPAGAVAGEAR